MMKGYVTSLAQYCGALFAGTSDFFAANATIEKAVLGEASIDAAVLLLSSSEDGFEDAKSRVGAVAGLYGQLVSSDDVSFGDQLDLLDEASKAIRTARMELALIDTDTDIQDTLWATPGLTANFADAMNAIMAANTWQAKFATSLVLVSA